MPSAGLITAVVIGASAGPFATFFDDPRLFYVVLALALAVLLDAFENVGVADFRRHFAFRREFQLSIFPRIAQVAVTIALAFTWANYWALVAGILTGTRAAERCQLCHAPLSAATVAWRPGGTSSDFRSGPGWSAWPG